MERGEVCPELIEEKVRTGYLRQKGVMAEKSAKEII